MMDKGRARSISGIKIMSDHLYSSLISLLPREYVQGDSSACDPIEVATNYIKDLEKNVKELKDERNKLKKSLSKIPNVGPSSTISTIHHSMDEDYVKIKPLSDGLEIEINAMVKEEDVFPLSKVFKIIQLEVGLSVVSCAYSKVHQRWMYVIHCQVDDGKLVDSSRLQWKLINEISSYASGFFLSI